MMMNTNTAAPNNINMSNTSRISRVLYELIQSIIARAREGIENQKNKTPQNDTKSNIDSQIHSLYTLSLKILSSRISYPSKLLYDELHTLNYMKHSVTHILHDGNIDEASHCTVKMEILYQRLIQYSKSDKQSVIRQRAAVLYLLSRLIGNGINQNQNHQLHINTIPALQPAPNNMKINHQFDTHTRTPCQSHNSNMQTSLVPATQSSAPASSLTGEHSLTTHRSKNTDQLLEQHQSYQRYELELIHDLLYVLQGINGRYMRYNENLDIYHIMNHSISITLPKPMKSLAIAISESGWLYRRIQRYINQRINQQRLNENAHVNQGSMNAHTNTNTAAVGLVEQSFASTLNDELSEYYRIIALLETQLQECMERSEAMNAQRHEQILLHHTSQSSPSPPSPSTSANTSNFTLRRLYIWIQEPIQRLRLLCQLTDSSSNRSGGALASSIHMYMNNGDRFIQMYVRKILCHISIPLLHQIERWIVSGELYDPYHEFFVTINTSMMSTNISNDTSQIWNRKYQLHYDMIPSFLPTHIAEKILLIGKSINFIRFFDDTWQTSLKLNVKQYTDLHAKPHDVWIDTPSNESLFTLIHQQSTLVNQAILRLILHTHNLKHHLNVIKRYILLSQGDYTLHLLDIIHSELDKPAIELYQHNLLSMLETAIRSSAASSSSAAASSSSSTVTNPKDKDLIESAISHITVRMLESSQGDIGWDIFSLQYMVDKSPLRVIFSQSSILKYQRIFKMLFALKHVEYNLNQVFTLQISNSHAIAQLNISILSILLRKSHAIRHEMNHFVTNLMSYMMFEVVEQAYSKLLDDIEHAADLDTLIKAHRLYLLQLESSILMGYDSYSATTLSSSSSSTTHQHQQAKLSLADELYTLFALMIQYSKLQQRIYLDVDTELCRRSSLKEHVAETAKQGEWGVSINDQSAMDDANQSLIQTFQRYYNELINVNDRFHAQLNTFLKHLSNVSNAHAYYNRGHHMNKSGGGGTGSGHPHDDTTQVTHHADDEEKVSDDSNLMDGDALLSPQQGSVNSQQGMVNHKRMVQAQLAKYSSQLMNLHDLEFLKQRIDFNDYYENQQKAMIMQTHIHTHTHPSLPQSLVFNQASTWASTQAQSQSTVPASGNTTGVTSSSNAASKAGAASRPISRLHSRTNSYSNEMKLPIQPSSASTSAASSSAGNVQVRAKSVLSNNRLSGNISSSELFAGNNKSSLFDRSKALNTNTAATSTLNSNKTSESK